MTLFSRNMLPFFGIRISFGVQATEHRVDTFQGFDGMNQFGSLGLRLGGAKCPAPTRAERMRTPLIPKVPPRMSTWRFQNRSLLLNPCSLRMSSAMGTCVQMSFTIWSSGVSSNANGSRFWNRLMRRDVLTLLGHRAFHQQYQRDQNRRQDGAHPEDIEEG
jgi:hypothetical protein